MLRRLLEREIPEIYSGTVEVKSIAREPGQRSKVAVAASQPGVDPVGSCVGLRGTRIQNIVDELNGEKIDVVEWNSEVRNFISNALSPARPSDTILLEDGDVRTAIVVVPDRQLSLAIGKEGQNARLAAKLTGWRIDIKSETEAATEGLSELKRQQLQAMKQRSLEAKAAALPPSDDLLSRAEWLLREKDKTAVTLEQAAKMLAEAEATTVQAEMLEVIEVPVPEAAAPQTEAAAPEAAALEGTEETPGAIAGTETDESAALATPPAIEGVLGLEELPLEVYEDVIEEEEGEAGDKKPAKKSKKTEKKRELVFDESLGQVIARKKRKPGRGGWEEFTDY
jgi:N utilization substance protein A